MFQRDLRQWAKDRCGMKFDSSGMCVLFLSLFPTQSLLPLCALWDSADATRDRKNAAVRLERVPPEDGEGGVRAARARVGRSRLAERGPVAGEVTLYLFVYLWADLVVSVPLDVLYRYAVCTANRPFGIWTAARSARAHVIAFARTVGGLLRLCARSSALALCRGIEY